MTLFDTVISGIEKNKLVREKGGYIGIPYPFARLRNHIPVMEKGHSIGILAGTGVGKSRFARFVFVYEVYKFVKETGYPAQVFYFPLEDNKEKVYKNMICHYLREKLNILLTPQELDSKTANGSLPDWVLTEIKKARDYFTDLESVVHIIDHISDPIDIYNLCQRWSKKHGDIEYKIVKQDNGEEIRTPSKYTPKTDMHNILIVDNMSNFDSERGMDEREMMVKFAKLYVRKWLCNFFKWTCVQVMQMSFDKERQQFSNNGMSIISKIEPSLDGIGEAKVIARSMHIIFGLFNPERYEILAYPNSNGYDIAKLGNCFRALKVLKCNDAQDGMRFGLFFDAIGEIFTELPLPSDKDALDKWYQYAKNGNVKENKLFK